MLYEFDYKAVEAVMVGWYARDPDYIRAAQLGIHAILASHVLGRPINLSAPDDLIRLTAREIKIGFPAVYDACKVCCHLSAYGGTPFKMKVEYPELFKSMKDAENLQHVFFETIGKKIRNWQQATLQKAHRQCYLENVFGYRHYFWDVFHWDSKKRREVLGTDANRALAFLAQSSTAGLIKEAMLRAWQADPWFHDKLLLQVHDSLMFDLPDDSRVAEIKRLMEAPLPEMGNLSFEVEVSCGRNWGEMEEYSHERFAIAGR